MRAARALARGDRRMGRVLVTGGAGYVGSHVVRRLVDARREVVVLDDLSLGHRAAVGKAFLVEGNCADASKVDEVLSGGGFDAVVHLAGSCLVGESMTDPARYYENNLANTLSLLDAMRRRDVKAFVFSSSAAVYGEPQDVPMGEEHPCRPSNPYGETKLAVERLLGWYQRAYGIRYAALRYFNAAGAHESAEIGEDHGDRESHLIPRLIRSLVHGGPPTPILGEDYPTSDGTCVRDYVHVMDLADAHVLALSALERGALEAGSFNLGNGEGFSVREVAPAHPATMSAPIKAGPKIVISFHVIPGTDQSESHSETDVLIHNDQRTQITQKVPTVRRARETISPQV
jgi:UDP-glucose 4-epimerase